MVKDRKMGGKGIKKTKKEEEVSEMTIYPEILARIIKGIKTGIMIQYVVEFHCKASKLK